MKRIAVITALCVMLLSGCGCSNRDDVNNDGIIGNDNAVNDNVADKKPDKNDNAVNDNMTDDSIVGDNEPSSNARGMLGNAANGIGNAVDGVGNAVEDVGRGANNVMHDIGNAMR